MFFKKDFGEFPLLGLGITIVLTTTFHWNPVIMIIAALIAIAVS